MKKLNLSTLTGFPVFIMAVLLLTASCSRSPYNFVRVQPKPFDKVAAVSSTPAQPIPSSTLKTVESSSAASVEFAAPAGSREPSGVVSKESNKAVSNKRQAKKDKEENTSKVVKRELQKSAAFGALPAKKLKKVEKIISKQANKLAEKKAAAAASPVGFNQWMKIGVILLLIGLVVGIAFADLGYIVAVIGVVFLVLGLIQQL